MEEFQSVVILKKLAIWDDLASSLRKLEDVAGVVGQNFRKPVLHHS